MFDKLFSKALLINVLIALVIIALLLLMVQWGLKSYTRHGESIPVPDLRGMDLARAMETLEDKNLEWVILDSVFDVSKPPFTVIDQNPRPQSRVKQGRKIYLTVNASTAPTAELPDLVGRSSYKFAKMQLESYGFKVGEPIYKPDPHRDAVIGMLVDGQPATRKMKVKKGSTITLILGDGLSNTRIGVPYLIGLRYDEAEFKLKGYSLNVGALIIDEGVKDTASAIVYKQFPEFGKGNMLHLGEPIDLWLAKELPEGIVVQPELYDVIETDSTNQ
ncbi:MAG: PASTA domain-containing protein [Chitinophagales bacterium]|nr:PASTA domain-containing protein [Chitinophagales bacterium]MDW8418374.1 PASTA domain-containing protein [Chitinophagales bacterium]